MDEVKETTDIAKELLLRDGYHMPFVFIKATR